VVEMRAKSTEILYGRFVQRLLRRSRADGVETVGELGEWMRRQPWSVATLRLYRMALLWYFVDLGQQGTREAWAKSLGLDGAVRLKRRGGPGKRRKSEKGWEPVKAWLEAREGGRDVALWMEAGMRAGWRPVEWWTCRIDPEQRRLWLATAKAKSDAAGNRLRGVGIEDESGRVWRYLDFASEEDWRVVQAAVQLRDRLAWERQDGVSTLQGVGTLKRVSTLQRVGTLQGVDGVLAEYARWLRRGWDAVHGAKRPRITLYSARHIFAGRMKKAGVGRRELAAAMGQISTKSSKVYGRTLHAGGVRPGVVIPAVLVESVRQPAPGLSGSPGQAQRI
jgi:hypothetical protein